jgi:CubicO group peptidase (beta-lactamase class C family)
MAIQASTLVPSLDKVVSEAITKHQPIADTGVSVAVIQSGQPPFTKGYGYRDRANSAPVDDDTCFAIGSATKAFTAMAVLMAVADGQVTLDQPIKQILPDFQLKDQTATDQATLTDLLVHRTGLAPHNCLWYLGPFTRSGLYYRLRYLDFAAPFRSTYIYNNLMYMLAGHLLETITSINYEEIIRSRITEPLGMAATSLRFTDFTDRPDHALGYELGDPLELKDFTNIGPAGQINSTAKDMAAWVQLFLSKGLSSNGVALLGPDAMAQLYTPVIDVGDGTKYGLGWNISSITPSGATQAKKLIFHTGDPVGGSAYVSFMPDDGLGVVVLTNQHCTDKLIGHWPDEVALDIYEALLSGGTTSQAKSALTKSTKRSLAHGLGMAAASAAAAAPVPAAPAAAAPAPVIDPSLYTGMYSNDGYGDFAISRSGNNLSINYYGSSWSLVPVSNTVMTFVVAAFGTRFPIGVFFARDSAGAISGFGATLVLNPHVMQINFVKR